MKAEQGDVLSISARQSWEIDRQASRLGTGCEFSVAQQLLAWAKVSGNSVIREQCGQKNAWDSVAERGTGGAADTTAARALLQDPAITVEVVAERLQVSPATVSRHVPGDRSGLEEVRGSGDRLLLLFGLRGSSADAASHCWRVGRRSPPSRLVMADKVSYDGPAPLALALQANAVPWCSG